MCKPYLLGCCPHDLLASSRYNIGPCGDVHDPQLKEEYAFGFVVTFSFEKDPSAKNYRFEEILRSKLREQIRKCDSRIRVGIMD